MQQGNDNIRGWQAASEIAGRSIGSLRRLVATGKLASTPDAAGRHVFVRGDLEQLGQDSGQEQSTWSHVSTRTSTSAGPRARASLTDVERAVYEDLAAGRDLADIALARSVDPDWLCKRAEAWVRLQRTAAAGVAKRVDQLEAQAVEAEDRADRLEANMREYSNRLETLSAVVEHLRSEYDLTLVVLRSLLDTNGRA